MSINGRKIKILVVSCECDIYVLYSIYEYEYLWVFENLGSSSEIPMTLNNGLKLNSAIKKFLPN